MKTVLHYIPCAFLLVGLLWAVPAAGQTDSVDTRSAKPRKEKKVYPPVLQYHELRVGWGDMMFETLVWHERDLLPSMNGDIFAKNFRYTQHWFAEYLYRVNFWFGVGGMVDYGGVYWDKINRDAAGNELDKLYTAWFANISIMPVLRFTYYEKNLVRLYSALGYGLNINTGTEVDYKGRETACAGVLNLTLLGVSVGNDRVFGSIELGGMFSIANKQEIYLLDSRIFTASIGVRL